MLDQKYDPQAIDQAAQELWEAEQIHRFDPDAPEEVFSVDTPPPTVSGSCHIGHVFSYTQAECIVRYQRMRGRNVFYPFGFDGNGLPTERLTEKEHDVLGRSMPRDEFIRLCLETSRKYELEFEALWRSLGVSADWSLVYSTIDERAVRVSQLGFCDLYDKGEVFQKESPTLWDVETQTAVAQAELASKTKRTLMNDVRFDLADGGHVVVATTRPEMLAACVGMFVNPDDPRASELLGRKAIVPLFGHEVEFRAATEVDPEKGTGVVMCCTFGDKTDVEWYQKHGLELRQAIGADGRMTDIAGPEAGLYINQARRAILERLKEAGHLEGQEEIENAVNTYERTGREIEFLPTRQWFVRVLDKKADLIRLGEQVRWFPAHMGKRYRNWVEGLEWDWCISRQRFFGVPFPLWTCDACGEVFVAPASWLPIMDHGAHEADLPECPRCQANSWTPEQDVMDTWATSSETPEINARWGEPEGERRSTMPMSLRPQAHDIIRTWAFYTIAKSWLHFQDVPWHDVMVSGHVQAPGRHKISKSKGNAPTDPSELVKTHGADAVRYWALSATLGNDYVYSEEDLKQGRRLCVKLWNAARLAMRHLEGFRRDASTAEPEPIDRWIRARLAETRAVATQHLDEYEFGIAKGDVERFFWNDLCDNYLEMIKNRLHDDSEEGAASREAARAGLYDALYGALRLFGPFVPHVCEVIHQDLFAEQEGVASIGRAPWPTEDEWSRDEEAERAGRTAVDLLTVVRRWRSEEKVSPGKEIARVVLGAGADHLARIPAIADAVRAAGRSAELEVRPDEGLGPEELTLVEIERA